LFRAPADDALVDCMWLFREMCKNCWSVSHRLACIKIQCLLDCACQGNSRQCHSGNSSMILTLIQLILRQQLPGGLKSNIKVVFDDSIL